MYLKRRTLERRLRRMRLRAKGEASAPHVKALVAAMNAVREQPPAADSRPAAAEERNRLAVAIEVSVRKAGGFNFQLRAFDISPGGCKVELVEAVDPSERVIVRLPAIEPLGAEVAWVSGNKAGLRFERALHPAVFDHFVGRLGAA